MMISVDSIFGRSCWTGELGQLNLGLNDVAATIRIGRFGMPRITPSRGSLFPTCAAALFNSVEKCPRDYRDMNNSISISISLYLNLNKCLLFSSFAALPLNVLVLILYL